MFVYGVGLVYPSVLRYCCFGDRKGIQPLKSSIPTISRSALLYTLNWKTQQTEQKSKLKVISVGGILEAIIPSTNCSRINVPSPRLSWRRKKSVMRNFLSRIHAMYRCLHSWKLKLLKLSSFKPSTQNSIQ